MAAKSEKLLSSLNYVPAGMGIIHNGLIKIRIFIFTFLGKRADQFAGEKVETFLYLERKF